MMRLSCKIFVLASLILSGPAQFMAAAEQEELYGGQTANQWVSEVLRLANIVRKAEEEYEIDLKDCTNKRREMDPNRVSCIRAKEALALSQSTRAEYQRLVEAASRTSLPLDWLKAHFIWVRNAEEWKRTINN